jgi:lycopene beta-cyclase
VVVVGGGSPWTATYGTWRDDVPSLPGPCFASTSATVIVHGQRRHVVEREYAVFDNRALRAHLAAGLDVHTGRAERVRPTPWGSTMQTTDGSVDARMIVAATGHPATSPATAAQTAYGVVVGTPPGAVDRTAPTLMDLRPAGTGVPTFSYVVRVTDGWLVEETVLASRPPVPPTDLAGRLAARIGHHLARRTELVAIPVGGRLPARRGEVPRFGAAAGYIHPATGYSVAASIRAAPRVAAAIASACERSGRPATRPVWDAVWPAPLRHTRRLHAYGLEVLLRLDQDQLATFFDTFFDLPVEVWSPYLRIDASPLEVSRAMTAVLRRLPRGVRRRLVVDPRGAWR